MSNDDAISSRIEILRFPLIVGVVFIHSFSPPTHLAQGAIGVTRNDALADFVMFFISQGVARIAVPLFFLVSGYLFFLGGWSWKKHGSKLKRRLHTLLIPFLFWNLLTLMVYAVGQNLPQTKMFFSNSRFPQILSFSLLNYLQAIFGTSTGDPLAFQFWFIRDLMALVVIAPAIYFAVRSKVGLVFLAALFCLWFSGTWSPPWLGVVALFFFSLGAYLSQPGMKISYLDKFGPWVTTAFLICVCLRSAFPNSPLNLNKIEIVFGVPSVWWLTKFAVRSPALRSALTELSGASFFVFAAHEPSLTILQKLTYKLLQPTSGFLILILYLLTPLFLIALLVTIYRCLLKKMPSFLGFITGSSNRHYKPRA
jgi:fucose 4-O-acetylase-like acetyltransferase